MKLPDIGRTVLRLISCQHDQEPVWMEDWVRLAKIGTGENARLNVPVWGRSETPVTEQDVWKNK